MILQEYIKSARPESFKGDGSRYFQCPHCKGHRKLEVNPNTTKWFCHKCGTGGRLPAAKVRQDKNFSSPSEPPVLFPAEPGSLVWGYLSAERKIPERLIRELRPHQGKDPWLVYFPFYDWGSDQPCYFTARTVVEGQGNPYWNPPMGMYSRRKSDVLWGLHRIQKPIPVGVICEGVLDALWYPQGMAILGKTISEAQMGLLNKIVTEEIVVMLDGDTDRSAHYLADKIARRSARHVSIVELPSGCDPDDLCKRNPSLEPYMERRRRVI